VKSISSLLFVILAMLPGFSSSASDRNPTLCVEKPLIEKPNFETRLPESRQREDLGIEKPVFEKASFQIDRTSRPRFEKSTFEKPVFQMECIESSSLAVADAAATAKFVPFPSSIPSEKWKPIQSGNRKTRFHPPVHQLQRRSPPGYR
jgi:hypothetical protein